MADLSLRAALPAMSSAALGKVRALECEAAKRPQIPLDTQHVLHAGLYARTIRMPAGTMITGALVKIATLVIVQGSALVWLGDTCRRLDGYNVLPASAGRKQAFVSIGETFITMIFPTEARDVESAERQFTDEFDLLASRRCDTPNLTIITGE